MQGKIICNVLRRLVEYKHELDKHDGVFVTSPRDVIEMSQTDLSDEWLNAHVLSVDDMQFAVHGLYDEIFDEIDATHKDYVDYDV